MALLALLALLGLAATALMSGPARSQINASPSWVPIGVSTSGTSSTVWFHEPSSRQAVACRAIESQGNALSGVQCVVGKLP
ncbi:MAG: hypothetical protein HZC37_21810 [Burkholderiales bacterium]|nr:hypothetical protein [Burkholderiales bacterium]